MASSILAGLIKGIAGSAVTQIDDRRKLEQEAAKERMLSQLRLDTEKELTMFKESRPDFKEEMRGKQIVNDANAEKFRQDKELFPLDQTYRQKQIDKLDQDVANDRTRLGLEGARLNLDRARTNEEIRASRARTDNGDGGTSNTGKALYADYAKTFDRLKELGTNPYTLLRMQARWQKGLQNGWSTKQQRMFLQGLTDNVAKDFDPTATSTLPDLSNGRSR